MGAVNGNNAVLAMPLEMANDIHRVGPNAIIQTGRALDRLHGMAVRDAVFGDAGLGWMGRREPGGMVRAEAVVALNAAVLRRLAVHDAERVMWQAGAETARYILDHRIPRMAQRLIGLLPGRLGLALLLRAIARHGWTFAGAAHVGAGSNWICINNNPLCLGRSGYAGCTWHKAVFTTLIEVIIGREALVHETHCLSRGDDFCRFQIELGQPTH